MPATLLAVDDSVTMRKVLEMTFAGEDIRVVTADSADAALALVRSERPDIVVSDITLPGKTGFDLCEAIKRESPAVPVLLLSSKLHPYDAVRGQSANADDHIDKPFDSQQLIDKVKGLLEAPRIEVQEAQKAPPPPQPKAPAYTPPQKPAPRVPIPTAGQPRQPPPSNLRTTVDYSSRPTPAHTTSPGTPQQRPAPAPAAKPPPAKPPVQPAAPTPEPPPAAAAAVAAAAPAVDAGMADKLVEMGLTKDQVSGVLTLSHEVIERVVWEVVPVLAETMIKEEIQRLTAD